MYYQKEIVRRIDMASGLGKERRFNQPESRATVEAATDRIYSLPGYQHTQHVYCSCVFFPV